MCELAVHKEFYLTSDKVSALQTGDVEHPTGKQLGKNAIVACSQNYDQGLKLADSTKLAETVFELDCLDSTRLGTYSAMWHVYGLSSVLRARPLQSIYPNLNFRYRSGFNKLVFPRDVGEAKGQPQFVIMWTRAYDYLPNEQNLLWSPNHFVPCVLKELIDEGSCISGCNMAPFIAANVSLPICLPVFKESMGISTHISMPNVAKCVASNTVDQDAGITCSIPTCISSAPQCLTAEKSDVIQKIALVKLPHMSYKKDVPCTEKNQMKLTSFISKLSSDVRVHPIGSVGNIRQKMESQPLLKPSTFSIALVHMPNPTNQSSPCNKRIFQSNSATIHNYVQKWKENSVAEIESKAFNVELKSKGQADVNDCIDLNCSVSSSESDRESSVDDVEQVNNDLEYESENGQVVGSALKYAENECINNSRDDYVFDWLSDETPDATIAIDESETVVDCYSAEMENLLESVVPIEDISPPSPLPFPLLPYEWYIKQGKLFQANQVRSQRCKDAPIHDSALLSFMNRSEVSGIIDEHIKLLKDSIDSLELKKCYSKVKHLQKCLKTGLYIQENGPIIATQDIVAVYHSNKEHATVRSHSMYEILSKHFNLLQV